LIASNSRLTPRRRVRYSEGESDDPRCLLSFHSQAEYSVLTPQPEKWRGSKFNTPEDLAAFAQRFDEGVKKVFSDDRTAQRVKFGSPRDNDPEYGIRAGRLTLTG
jgi:hypothetical protein